MLILLYFFGFFSLIKHWRELINFQNTKIINLKDDDNFITIIFKKIDANVYLILRREYLKVIELYLAKPSSSIIYARFIDAFIEKFIHTFKTKFVDSDLDVSIESFDLEEMFYKDFCVELDQFHFKLFYCIFLSLKINSEFKAFISRKPKIVITSDVRYRDINDQFCKNFDKFSKRIEIKVFKSESFHLARFGNKYFRLYEFEFEYLRLHFKLFKKCTQEVDFIEKKLLNIRNKKIKARNKKIKARNQQNIKLREELQRLRQELTFDSELDVRLFSDESEDDEISD